MDELRLSQLSEAVGAPVELLQSVSGGDICEAFEVRS
ncbi:MAG: hypothetical protein ACI9OJ_001237 [Myxococcota bacterium]|jgi:hypothetical protein